MLWEKNTILWLKIVHLYWNLVYTDIYTEMFGEAYPSAAAISCDSPSRRFWIGLHHSAASCLTGPANNVAAHKQYVHAGSVYVYICIMPWVFMYKIIKHIRGLQRGPIHNEL
jgi:hypothetical protein